jgi:hypothetical protein
MRTTAAPWKPILPAQAAELLQGLRVPWWIAGGWALDLHLGAQSRPHKDLDVGILRRDVLQVVAHLASWEFFEVKDDVLKRLEAGESPGVCIHSLWSRRSGANAWMMQLLLDEAAGDSWVFRRDRKISLPLSTLLRYDPSGIPYLAPEVQLLYKARASRPQDEADFALVAPSLDNVARDWLHRSLRGISPEHPWLSKL